MRLIPKSSSVSAYNRERKKRKKMSLTALGQKNHKENNYSNRTYKKTQEKAWVKSHVGASKKPVRAIWEDKHWQGIFCRDGGGL